jgi:hypothetical protein
MITVLMTVTTTTTMKALLFCAVTQRRVAILYRRLRTISRFLLHSSAVYPVGTSDSNWRCVFVISTRLPRCRRSKGYYTILKIPSIVTILKVSGSQLHNFKNGRILYNNKTHKWYELQLKRQNSHRSSTIAIRAYLQFPSESEGN